jgi:thiamine kinase-like enzyme
VPPLLRAQQSARAGAPPLLLRLYGSLDSTGGEGEGGEAAVTRASPPSLFSRAAEVRVAEAVAALSLGPRCFVLFPNGRLEALLDGAPLTSPDMRSAPMAAAVAATLARFHTRTAAAPELAAPCGLWARLEAWHALATRAATAQPPSARRDALLSTLAALPAHVAAIRATLAPFHASHAPGSATVFSHNDLQHNNILALCAPPTPTAAEAAAGASAASAAGIAVALIDYEYALPAPACYDIGNHFCERAADYADAPSDGGGMLAYELRYPDVAARDAFCAAYLRALEPPCGDAAAAAALARAADTAALASHLLWGCWGVIQASASSITDFDFLGYADARFAEHGRHAARLAREAAA